MQIPAPGHGADKQQRQQWLVMAGLPTVRQKGEKTRPGDIAKQAGVDSSEVEDCFGNFNNFLVAAAAKEIELLAETIEHNTRDATIEQVVTHLVRQLLINKKHILRFTYLQEHRWVNPSTKTAPKLRDLLAALFYSNLARFRRTGDIVVSPVLVRELVRYHISALIEAAGAKRINHPVAAVRHAVLSSVKADAVQ